MARPERGITMIELMVALVILAIALLGVISLLLALQTHNQSFSDARIAYKGAQETMETVLSILDQPTFVAQDGLQFAIPALHPTALVGRVAIQDISPVATPNLMYQVTVSVDTTGIGLKGLNVSVVSRRTWVP